MPQVPCLLLNTVVCESLSCKYTCQTLRCHKMLLSLSLFAARDSSRYPSSTSPPVLQCFKRDLFFPYSFSNQTKGGSGGEWRVCCKVYSGPRESVPAFWNNVRLVICEQQCESISVSNMHCEATACQWHQIQSLPCACCWIENCTEAANSVLM